MFSKSLKTILAVAVVAAGSALSVSFANAGGSFGFYFGNGSVQTHGLHNSRRHQVNPYNPYWYGNNFYGYTSPGYYGQPSIQYAHPKCNPQRALNKAYRMGLYNPHITRVNHKKIVVKGYSHGNLAKVVFKRASKHCRVIKTRGIY